jgi:hypothetical protein
MIEMDILALFMGEPLDPLLLDESGNQYQSSSEL